MSFSVHQPSRDMLNARVLSLINPYSNRLRYLANDDDDTLSNANSTTIDSFDSSLNMGGNIRFQEEETNEDHGYYVASYSYSILTPGKFEYVKDRSLKKMLADAWQSITVTETWKFILETDLETIMWRKNPQTDAIFLQMEKLSSYEHSGSSLCHVMKCMKYIAENGEEQFRELFL